MHGPTAPPYALDAFVFPYAAIASCAGRAPLGGDLEMALGVLTAARLADGLLPPSSLSEEVRAKRAELAKQWILNLTMPNPARLALVRSFDASVSGPKLAADALEELARTVAGHIDAPSQQCIAALVSRLREGSL